MEAFRNMRKQLLAVLILFFVEMMSTAQGYVEYGRTTQSNVDMTLNNLGIIGNSFRGTYAQGFGSCEYPAGSGIEHLFNGGLWIGGRIDGSTIAVSTGAVSSSQGYSTGASGYEFTADLGAKLVQKSTLLDNQFYATDAVSHQDFVGNFTDKNILVPGSQQQISNHRQPLYVDVKIEAYNWNFSSANFFVPLTFTITNNGERRIDSVYVGYWCDFVIRNVNVFPPGGTPFYSGGGNKYVDSLCLAYEFDAENISANASSYAGLKFLGAEYNNDFVHPKLTPSFRCHYSTWLFNSGSGDLFGPQNDNQCYDRLRLGLNYRTNWVSLQNEIKVRGNRSNLVSVGPFASLQPGESIKVTFALVLGSTEPDGTPSYNDTKEQRAEFIRHAVAAQSSFNGEDTNFNGRLDAGEDTDNDEKITRWVFPEPPAPPKTKIIAKENTIEVYWSDNSVFSVDPVTRQRDFEGFRVYKTQLGFDMQDDRNIQRQLKLVASFDSTGNKIFFDNGFDSIKLATPVTFPNDTVKYHFKYVFKNIANGWQHAVAVTAFDRGNKEQNLESLESSQSSALFRVFPGTPANGSLTENQPFVYPNPYYGTASWEGGSKFQEDRKLTFANLPENCKVKIFTYTGDLVDEFTHNKQYTGADIRWYNTYSDPKQTVFSGGEHSWDLLSKNSQLIARGLYVFSVEDLNTGKTYPGKFAIVK